jgi:Arc/MetJ-type ribon-helix-helix transcriptional regulator
MSVTVGTKLTEKMLEGIDKLVESGIYTSRSEALRDSARLLLGMHIGSLKGKPEEISKDEIVKSFLNQ